MEAPSFLIWELLEDSRMNSVFALGLKGREEFEWEIKCQRWPVSSHQDWKSKCVQERSQDELWEAVLTSPPFLDVSVSHPFPRIYSSLPYHSGAPKFSIAVAMPG